MEENSKRLTETSVFFIFNFTGYGRYHTCNSRYNNRYDYYNSNYSGKYQHSCIHNCSPFGIIVNHRKY